MTMVWWPAVLKKRTSGQSLIEAIIALAIILLAAVGLLAGISSVLKNSQFSKNQATATKYAQEALEQVRDLRNRDLTFWERSGTMTDHPNSVLTREVTYTLDPDGNGNNHKMRVTVVVWWLDATGKHQSKLTTDFTKW